VVTLLYSGGAGKVYSKDMIIKGLSSYPEFPYTCFVSPDSKTRRAQFTWCTEHIGISNTGYTYKTKHLITWAKSGQDDRMLVHFKNEKDALMFWWRWQ